MKKLIALTLALLLMISAAAAERPLAGGWTPSADPAVRHAGPASRTARNSTAIRLSHFFPFIFTPAFFVRNNDKKGDRERVICSLHERQ